MNPLLMKLLQTLFGANTGRQTQELRADISSPIPTSQIVPHPQTFSLLQQALIHGAQGLGNQMHSFLPGTEQPAIASSNFSPLKAAASPTPSPSITPSPTPSSLGQLTQQIANGFMKYGRPEAAKYAQYFAQAGQNLPDPLMPATLSLKETSGGKNLSHANNWLNIGPDIDYPDVPSNIVGGNGKKGFSGIINSGLYDKYLKSGDLHDFFNVYTPQTYTNPNGTPGYNGNYPQQIQQYNQLRSYFTNN